MKFDDLDRAILLEIAIEPKTVPDIARELLEATKGDDMKMKSQKVRYRISKFEREHLVEVEKETGMYRLTNCIVVKGTMLAEPVDGSNTIEIPMGYSLIMRNKKGKIGVLQLENQPGD